MNEIQNSSLNSLKLGTVVVHAKLIFLYFQISAKQNCYGFTRGDYLELLPGFPGNSGNRGNPTSGDLPARGDLPCRVSEKGGSREATSLLSSSIAEVRSVRLYKSYSSIARYEVRLYKS